VGCRRTHVSRAPAGRPALSWHAAAPCDRTGNPSRAAPVDPRRAGRQPGSRRGRAADARHERQNRGPGDPRPCAREQALPAQPGIASRPFGGDRDATARRTMNPFRVALAVARKDLRSEWRTRELVPALAQFIILALLIGNFGFQIDSRSAPSIAPGILWLALVFAGLIAFGRTFAAEREQSSLEAMLMTPASPVAIFAGKALAASALLILCEVVLLPALSLFFGTPFSAELVIAVLLATIGMASLGCLFAAVVARVRARELLLPLLVLPLWIPFIVAGGQAVQSAMGLPGSYDQAIGLLVDFDILFVVLTSLAARFVLDARLNSSLVLLIIYAGYLLVRRLSEAGRQTARIAAVVGIFGFIDVPVVYFSVDWWATHHPGPVITSDALPPQMLATFLFTM